MNNNNRTPLTASPLFDKKKRGGGFNVLPGKIPFGIIRLTTKSSDDPTGQKGTNTPVISQRGEFYV